MTLCLSLLGIGQSYSQTPLLTLGQTSAWPGTAATLSISLTSGITNAAGLNLYLKPSAPVGVPPLSPSFSRGAATSNWLTVSDSANPWHFAIANSIGIAGPAELLRLTVQVPESSPEGTVYEVNAESAVIADDAGQETNITSRVRGGSVTVLAPPYGDLNNDGAANAGDVIQMLRILLKTDPPTSYELRVGDVRPKPGLAGRSFGDGKIGANDVNWVLRRSVGLATHP